MDDRILKIVYGDGSDIERHPELVWGTVVDQAHLVMLQKQDLIDENTARLLLKEIIQLRKDGFKPLAGSSFQRGVYIEYETYLQENLGVEVSGKLHTGRSRNDLFATVFRMHTRDQYKSLIPQIFALNEKILELADQYKNSVSVVHTQLQPAMFGTFGYFFCGVAEALIQHTDQVQKTYELNEINPLGSGAAVGTSLSISPEITTTLLGFSANVENALQGVAHYEYTIEMASTIVAYATLLSRLATNMHIWASAEFGFVKFKKGTTGKSSMLPQKNNPFLLEIVNARIAALMGTLPSMIAGFANVPFSNAIETKSAAKLLWPFLTQFEDVLTLMLFILDNIEFDAGEAAEKDIYKNSKALYLAEQKMTQDGVSFREAYNEVSEMIVSGTYDLGDVEIAAVVDAFKYGGGPNSKVSEKAVANLSKKNQRQKDAWQKKIECWDMASEQLDKTVSDLL